MVFVSYRRGDEKQSDFILEGLASYANSQNEQQASKEGEAMSAKDKSKPVKYDVVSILQEDHE